MNNKIYYWLGFVALLALFIMASIVFRIFEIEILPAQFYGALLGVVITAIITVLLLNGQTANEEKRDKSVKVFEKKQEIYHAFLGALQQIIQDGEITIGNYMEDGTVDRKVDELKDLIFQLGYLQMHASVTTSENVLKGVKNIIQQLNEFNAQSDTDKQKILPEFYSALSNEVFTIVATLKNDLYGGTCETIKEGQMNDILRECNLAVSATDCDRYEAQTYFWGELQRLLKEKGYDVPSQDFKEDISQYYAKARNRHRYFGLTIPIVSSTLGKFDFRIEIENEIYYGFPEAGNEENRDRILQMIGAAFNENTFARSEAWLGWKYPDNRYRLNFWRMDSEGFEQLKQPLKREKFMRKFVEDMDFYIRKFIEAAAEPETGNSDN